jgi:hypothetical protein
VTPSWGDSGFSKPGSADDRKPTWPRVAVLVGVFALALFVAKGCQDRQVEVTQEEAVASAKEQVDFTPSFTQVRLLRQGINRKAYWFVSLSIPIGFDGDRADLFAALAVVEIDARTGEVRSVKTQSPLETRRAKKEAAQRDQEEAVQRKLEELSAQSDQ